MMVTFVSQCEKKALNRTRRVLDAFANRIGDNTWQTVITLEGLGAVKNLLRKSASKNTAVSCHWIRSRSRSDLVWVVGNSRKFNNQGIVPVNTTKRDVLKSDWQNNWSQAFSIQVAATLAALLHDLGKATVGFQRKLQKNAPRGLPDTYRHEWISLHLSNCLIRGCTTDEEWLHRLTQLPTFLSEELNWLEAFGNQTESSGLEGAPPLAQLLGWLIVTHHRLPFYNEQYFLPTERRALRQRSFLYNYEVPQFLAELKPTEYWIKNPKDWDARGDHTDYWTLKAPLQDNKKWQTAIARWSKKALGHSPLLTSATELRGNTLFLHLTRLCLMVGDHNFSSLTLDQSNKVISPDRSQAGSLLANTDQTTKEPKQALDQHLLGVGLFTSHFARILPQLAQKLPYLEAESAKELQARTNIKRFQWQNKAFDLAKSIQADAKNQGFFGINMASTGTGKTIANARIMYGLSDPNQGARFTIALGLRVLTLQTGQALGERMKLSTRELAVLIGSSASRKLFAINQEANEENQLDDEFEAIGSGSLEDLIEEEVHFDDDMIESGLIQDLGTVIENPKARSLLFAPVVACTIDHIIKATETVRGGKHIAPMLRLLSSDLVLDEPDDFGQSDMAALTRLVHFAGMLGSRVLLSSATLTPDLSVGLFTAYSAGRKIWNEQQGITNGNIKCGWFDENKVSSSDCKATSGFEAAHKLFVDRRVTKLQQAPVRHWAEVLPVTLPPKPENKKIHYASLARFLLDESYQLQQKHAETKNGKRASVGLIRMANIDPFINLALEFYKPELRIDGAQFHLCCYHAQQLLILRNGIETKLDKILSRSSDSSLFDHPEIVTRIDQGDAEHHVFIVLATAVAEVGRDHDYDWAIVEPSSMRSIIQLAGRVWRHRPDKIAKCVNIKILDANVKALEHGNALGVGHTVFQRPGFEGGDEGFLLQTHNVSELISPEQMYPLNAVPRISKPAMLRPTASLADLEHEVMRTLLNNPRSNYVNGLWTEDTSFPLNCHLQKISPFREQDKKQSEYVYLPDANQGSGFSFYLAENAWKDGQGAATNNHQFNLYDFENDSESTLPWLNEHLSTTLDQLSERLEHSNKQDVALRYATVTLRDLENRHWNFNFRLGFWY